MVFLKLTLCTHITKDVLNVDCCKSQQAVVSFKFPSIPATANFDFAFYRFPPCLALLFSVVAVTAELTITVAM